GSGAWSSSVRATAQSPCARKPCEASLAARGWPPDDGDEGQGRGDRRPPPRRGPRGRGGRQGDRARERGRAVLRRRQRRHGPRRPGRRRVARRPRADVPLARLALGRDDGGEREQPRRQARLLPGDGRARRGLGRSVMPITDTFGRALRNLRISVTDRCNLRCQYCMPEEDYVWLAREDILQFEEVGALVDVLADLGVDKVRLTGG